MTATNINKLTALQVKKASKTGRYSDGNCLYLYVDDNASKRWVLRLVVRGKRRDMGLGSAALVSLEEARDLASYYKTDAERLIAERLAPKNSVVPIEPESVFYPVRNEHQDYYKKQSFRYTYYRFGCGRDSRLDTLNGN